MRTALALLAMFALAASAPATTVSFDFDSGWPSLNPTMPLPISQTAGGVTALFSGRFSVQSQDTTFYNLPNFSGNYLDPSDVFSPSLTIAFDHLLGGLSFDFATADFGLDTNTTLKLLAYRDSTSNPVLGWTTSQAVGEGWGLGSLSFDSGGTPFNVVEIVILPGAGSDFLADNFTAVTAVPEPASAGVLALGLLLVAVFYSRCSENMTSGSTYAPEWRRPCGPWNPS